MKSVQKIFNIIFSRIHLHLGPKSPQEVFRISLILFFSFSSMVVLFLFNWFLQFSNFNNIFATSILIPFIFTILSVKKGNLDKSLIALIIEMHLIIFVLSFHSLQLKILSLMYLITTIYKINLATESMFANNLNYALCAIQYFVQRSLNTNVSFDFYEYISIETFGTYILLEGIMVGGLKYYSKIPAEVEQKKEVKKEQCCQDNLKQIEVKLLLIRIFVLGVKDFIQQIDEVLSVTTEKTSIDVLHQKLKPLKHGTQHSIILLKNIIDLSKKLSEPPEATAKVVDPVDFMQKIMTFNFDAFSNNDINTQVFLNKSMPSFIRIDVPKVLQVIITLLLFSLKNSKKKGKILLFISWADSSERRTLLNPFEESSFLRDSRNYENSTINQNQNEVRLTEALRESFRLSECDVGFMQPDNHHLEPPDPKKIKSLFEVNEFNKVIMKRFRLLEQSIYSPAQESRSFSNGYIKIEISDNGLGIAQEELANILIQIPSFNDDNQLSKPGIILWACKNLCLMMGGDMAVYSKPNQGSTIVFYFPAESNSLKLARLIPERRTLKVLIVDPDSLSSNAQKKLIEKEGIKVIVAIGGNEALEAIIGKSEETFDLAIIDLELRDLSAITLGREIRKYEQAYKKNMYMDLVFLRNGESDMNSNFLREIKSLEGHNVILKKPIDKNNFHPILNRLTNKFSDTSPSSKESTNKGDLSFGVRNRVNQVQQTLRKAI